MTRRVWECQRKQRHQSRGAAEAHLRALARRFDLDAPMHAYCCIYCNGWHVGRMKKEAAVSVESPAQPSKIR